MALVDSGSEGDSDESRTARAGRIGALHAGVLARDPGVDEILVGDADPQRAEEVAQEVGGEAGRIEAVLGAGPDAVVIAASTPAHAP